MSQFACPLCGKNSSIDHYDPDELDLDLKVVTYGSTGRGGIYVADKSSILGQDDPIEQAVAGRNLKLTKMFLDAGSLNGEQVTAGLGLSPEKAITYDPSRYTLTSNHVPDVNVYELELLRKQNSEEREIKTTLLEISRLCDSEFNLTEDLELTLQINDSAKHDLEFMELFEAMNEAHRGRVLRRITSKDPEIIHLLELLAAQPKRKDFMERLMDIDFH